MKPILAWIKANLVVVICAAVILAVLPTAWVISSGWNKRLRADREKAAADQLTKVTGAQVVYSLPAFEPGVEPISLKRAPNAAVTAWFAQQRGQLSEQAQGVIAEVEAFNRGVGPRAAEVGRAEHRPFVQGLFPSATDQALAQLKARLATDFDALPEEERTSRAEQAGSPEAARAAFAQEKFDALPEADRTRELAELAREIEDPKRFEMEAVLLGTRGFPNPYVELLRSIRAGGPANPAAVRDSLQSLEARERQALGIGVQGRQLTPEELSTIARKMSDQRLAEYLARASEISVYATLDALGSRTATEQGIPRGNAIPVDLDNVEEYFLWQWDYWFLSDIMAAVRLANARSGGGTVSVAEAPIKRIVRIAIERPSVFFPVASEGGMEGDFGGGFAAPAAPTSDVPGMTPKDLTASFTGRNSGSWNQLYDVRRAKLTLIVSSARLQEVLAAFPRVNLMNVTGIAITEVDPVADLDRGFAYGPDHVVQVVIDLESLWLRSWILPLMPPSMRQAVGVQEATQGG